MSRLKKFPWLSLILLLIAYSVFGWIVSQSTQSWAIWLVQQGKGWGWLLEEDIVSGIVYLLGAVSILLLVTALTAPVTLMTFFLGSSLQSDIKGFISLLGWAFAFVLIVCWIEYFVRFLVLLAAAILARLELQKAGYNEWQTFAMLAVVCLSGLGLGLLTFELWGNSAP